MPRGLNPVVTWGSQRCASLPIPQATARTTTIAATPSRMRLRPTISTRNPGWLRKDWSLSFSGSLRRVSLATLMDPMARVRMPVMPKVIQSRPVTASTSTMTSHTITTLRIQPPVWKGPYQSLNGLTVHMARSNAKLASPAQTSVIATVSTQIITRLTHRRRCRGWR